MSMREISACFYKNCCTFLAFLPAAVSAQSLSLTEVVAQSKVDIELRYRIEGLKEDNESKDATASTLRSRVGVETPQYRNLQAFIEFEDIHAVGNDNYNSTTNGKNQYSTIADPQVTELNQAYVDYTLNETRFRYGRQRMSFDNARFVGNAGWRQNERTFDGLLVTNTFFPGSRIAYAYIASVQRVLGDDHPVGEFDMDSHLLNYRYQQLNGNVLSLYGYYLEVDNSALTDRSHKTIGIRYKGTHDFKKVKGLYTLEYADQSEYADGTNSNDAQYTLLQFGLKFSNQWVSEIGLETLEGNGVYALQTPLATLTAFNGEADIFAAGTPLQGLVDTYLKVSAPISGLRLDVSYHDFSSDKGNVDYGRETDVKIVKRFNKHWQLAAKYTQYSAHDFAVNTKKLSLWVEMKF